MTFNRLFEQFKNKYGSDHDAIFFTLLFYISKVIKSKEDFVQKHLQKVDFKIKQWNKLCNLYFVKQCPLSHITHHTTFCKLDFRISKKVLSPRDVTEQMTLDFISAHKNDKSAQVIDLCCGCGCIGISIKKYIPHFFVVCIDKYWNPIFDTHDNGIKNKTALTVDCKDAIKYLNKKQFADFIISNPPYINPKNFNNKKMFKWENKKALIAKENGLYFYKKYFEWLSSHPFKEAWFEIGYDQTNDIKNEISKYQNLNIEFPPNRQYIIITRKY